MDELVKNTLDILSNDPEDEMELITGMFDGVSCDTVSVASNDVIAITPTKINNRLIGCIFFYLLRIKSYSL